MTAVLETVDPFANVMGGARGADAIARKDYDPQFGLSLVNRDVDSALTYLSKHRRMSREGMFSHVLHMACLKVVSKTCSHPHERGRTRERLHILGLQDDLSPLLLWATTTRGPNLHIVRSEFFGKTLSTRAKKLHCGQTVLKNNTKQLLATPAYRTTWEYTPVTERCAECLKSAENDFDAMFHVDEEDEDRAFIDGYHDWRPENPTMDELVATELDKALMAFFESEEDDKALSRFIPGSTTLSCEGLSNIAGIIWQHEISKMAADHAYSSSKNRDQLLRKIFDREQYLELRQVYGTKNLGMFLASDVKGWTSFISDMISECRAGTISDQKTAAIRYMAALNSGEYQSE